MAAALLACGSGGSGGAKCVSALELSGQRFTSLGTHSEQAKAKESSVEGACIAYCQFGDPAVQAAHDKWRQANPASKARRESVITIHISSEVKACQARCGAAVKAGSAKVKTECL